MNATAYKTARSNIANGDVLGMSCRGALWALVKAAQCRARLGRYAAITHVGVAWWLNGRLYSVEMDGAHNVLRPLSQHIAEGSGVMVFRPPVPADAMTAQFGRATAAPIEYSDFDLLRIGLRLLLRRTDDGTALTAAQTAGHAGMVCSQFVARWLMWAGWNPPPGFPAMPSPGEVCRALGLPIFSIEAACERVDN